MSEADKAVGTEELNERILQELARKANQTSAALGRVIGVPKQEINRALYGPLRDKVTQDRRYTWSLRTNSTSTPTGPTILDTDLAKLAGYYLDCLAQDGGAEVSVWATSKYDSPIDYIEIDALPLGGDLSSVLSRPGVSEIVQGSLNKRMAAYLGYPVRMNRFRSKKGYWCEKVEPVLLLEIVRQDDGQPTLDTDHPRLNVSVLKALSGGQESSAVTDEWIALGRDLGLSASDGASAPLDDLAFRLRSIRSEWDWLEDTNPSQLGSAPRLSVANQPGIYNRAVIVRCETSPFTKGLEQELADLESVPKERYQATALGAWLEGAPSSLSRDSGDPLLEVVPLNPEQRQAVERALTQPLTVITGPPGTGKSQVVTALLANAALRGMRVLLSSKNNKAVDVVEDRVNALGDRPMLLRLGSSKYQEALSAYLTRLLSSPATESDRSRYQELQRERVGLLAEQTSLDKEERKTIKHRNACDAAEKEVEETRRAAGDELFARMRTVDVATLLPDVAAFQDTMRRGDRAACGLWARLFWPFLRKARLAACEVAWDSIADTAAALEVTTPAPLSRDEDVPAWASAAKILMERAEWTVTANTYFTALDDLSRALPLETINERRSALDEDLEENAGETWSLWTILLSDRLDSSQRQLLTQYASVLRMVAQGGNTVPKSTWRTYFELSNRVVGLLPCWATTALSVHGRIPFDPGYFDLVVIDEASQCDIPSALPLLYRAKRAVIIGDPQQLPHITHLHSQVDQQLLEQRGLLSTRPEWAYSTCNLYSLAASRTSPDAVVMLLDHHRSHADIIAFSNEHFYERKLRVATRYDRLKRPDGSRAVRWIDVSGQAEARFGSWANQTEAEAVLAELRRLVLDQGYSGTVGVVTPFRGQKTLIGDLVTQDGPLSSALSTRDFLVDSAHGFQGDERDAILMSPVVTHHMPEKTARWLDRTPNLFNVAITRARSALIVLGDRSAPAAHGIKLYEKFLAHVDSLAATVASAAAPSFGDLGPEYPKVSTNAMVSDWEKVLYQALYRAGIRTTPQYPVEKYLLDLALVIGDRRLAIEVDGEMYHRAWNGELVRRDQIRNRALIEQGWDVMRFWVYQVRDDLAACGARVAAWAANSKGGTP